ncbi:hypothetical protein [Nonomuraea sp. NEAU-A123]|uniref:hypothetical protein n=1 Tax=Nonomuraea sp. NEAU-A123 TaxID=2839649 RepID=UPI001BE49CF9|nr:hypothetical protein [Nonomuraea sp. NEAU-A123]MBT2227021.1 hypothetical protein [Nonomuraea sp. NEAU-A123]
MAANGDETPAENDCPVPRRPRGRTLYSTIGGGAAATAIFFGGALPITLLVIGVVLIAVLGIVAFALLGRGDERTPFERLMFLLGLLFGDPSGMVLDMQRTGQARQDIHADKGRASLSAVEAPTKNEAS